MPDRVSVAAPCLLIYYYYIFQIRPDFIPVYSLFFGSMTYLPAQTVVLFSYIDPIVAIFLSALLLKEPLGWSGILGTVLVLGSTLISELPVRAAAETK